MTALLTLKALNVVDLKPLMSRVILKLILSEAVLLPWESYQDGISHQAWIPADVR